MSTDDPLSRAFAALADPTRRAILERLAAGEAGVVELAAASTLATGNAARRDCNSRGCSLWTTGLAAHMPNGPTASIVSRHILPPNRIQP
jgi:DNA-binding transcriptional ArsR family regulator